MRVLFVSDHFFTPAQPGVLRTWQLSKYLCESGDRVTVVAPRVHYLFPDAVRAGPDELPQNLELVEVGSPPLTRGSMRSRLRYYASQFWGGTRAAWQARGVQVVVAGLTPSVLAFGAYLVARARRIPFVLDERDLAIDAALQLGILPRPLLRIARWFERRLHHGADAVVVVTPGLRRMLEAREVPAERIWLVPNGFDELAADSLTTRSELRAELGWDGAVVVLYAGSLAHGYDLDPVLDALGELRGTDVLLALAGEGERKELYRARAEAEDLPVQLLIARPKKEMPALCAAADIGIVPLRNIPWSACSLSNKLFDYLGAGTPVITTGPGDSADLVKRSGGGLVIPAGDPQAMASAIKTLADDSASRKAMGESARRYVLEHWRRDRFTPQFRKALLSVVERRSGGFNDEVDRIRASYRARDATHHRHAARRRENLGTRTMIEFRWRAIEEALPNTPPATQPRVLDVGCGVGDDLLYIRDLWRESAPRLYGVDLLPDRIDVAKQRLPDAELLVQSAETLPYPNEFFQVVLASVMFSSILDRALAESISRELVRVLAPGGVLLCYDFRFPSPTNLQVRPVTRRTLHQLFPGCRIRVRSMTLLPPLARVLGPLAPQLYGPLLRVPLLRSHYLAVIQPIRGGPAPASSRIRQQAKV